MTALKAWTVIVLEDMAREKVLLLRRSEKKLLLPDLVTGIGGKIEFEIGEAGDIEASALRELEEETEVRREHVQNLQMRLATIITEDGLTRLLYWMTGTLTKEPTSLASTEGVLEWHAKDQLPLSEMTRGAMRAIPFILTLRDDDLHIYSGAAKTDTNGDWEVHFI